MKILLASDFFPPTITGSAVHVYVLAKQLNTLGHQVIVVTIAQKNTNSYRVGEEGFKVYYMRARILRVGVVGYSVISRVHL